MAAKDVNEWPSKKVYDEKTPRPTQYYGKGNWMKPTPKPTEYIKTPKAPKTPEPTKDSYKGRTYSADEIYTELEKILLAEDPKAAIEEQLIIHGQGEEEGDDRFLTIPCHGWRVVCRNSSNEVWCHITY